MLIDALRIMLVGMGIVFLILWFLVLAVWISAKIIHAIEGFPKTAGAASISPSVSKKPISAVVAAAITAFKKDKGG